jgi:hypothetical protein
MPETGRQTSVRQRPDKADGCCRLQCAFVDEAHSEGCGVIGFDEQAS